jgi:hypothetical protein
VLVTCPKAFVLPVREVGPHDPVTLDFVVRVTASSKATPEPVVTNMVRAEMLVPSA